MSALIVLIGIPGSGKSTLAASLPGTVVSTDAIRAGLYGGESITYHEPTALQLLRDKQIDTSQLSPAQLTALKESLCVDHIFDLARAQCRHLLLAGHTVIYDSTNFKRKYRHQLLQAATGAYDRCDVYFLDIPLSVCLARNSARSRQEPEDTIAAISQLLVPPTYDEGFDNIYRVDHHGCISRIPNQ